MANPKKRRIDNHPTHSEPFHISDVCNFLEQIKPLNSEKRKYQLQIEKLIADWQVPENIQNAALLLPWINQISDKVVDLELKLPSSTAEILSDWNELFQLTIIPLAGGHQQEGLRSLKLRRLMRLAYLNLPLVILTVVDHTARIDACSPETENSNFWIDTESIFLPLLKMLGLWGLRREWIEKIFKQVEPKAFEQLKKRLDQIAVNQKKYTEYVQSEINKWRPPDISPLKCELRNPTAGRILYLSQQGEPIDELIDTIKISITVRKESDCYTILELLHKFGTPIPGRFSDYLADPIPNGYKAIHTTIIGNKKNLHGRQKTIKFQISTPEMDEINQMGIIKGLFQAPQKYQEIIFWWRNYVPEKTLKLVNKYAVGDLPKDEDNNIYAFMPHGGVTLLVKGSTALDFAYHLHTQLGHHCRSVKINGHDVPHSTELYNGDLILLNHDPFFQGPDPAWLHIVKSEQSRKKIKQGLRLIRKANHPGRLHIGRYLEALRKDSDFVVPDPQLEKYFMMAAEELGYHNVEGLFDAIVPSSEHDKRSLAPEKLISFILSAELAMAVVDDKNNPIVRLKPSRPSFSQPLMRFCPNCKPAPGALLILHRKQRRNYERLTLHRKPVPPNDTQPKKEKLFGLPAPDRITCVEILDPAEMDEKVKWGNVSLGRLAANITIVARDRSHLIGELLLLIYTDDRVSITYIHATSDQQGTASILFVVEADTEKQINNLTNKLWQASGVTNVRIWPVTLSQSKHYNTRPIDKIENPYTPGPVRDYQMLYGREEEKEKIREWLTARNPQNLIILRGQRRSGKTSLGKFSYKYLPPNIRTIYVDMLEAQRNPTAANIYMTIMKRIFETLKRTVPSQISEDPYSLPDWEQLEERPSQIFFSYLRRIQELIRPHRLLLILDEFNAIEEKCTDESFYLELRSLTMDNFPDISLMLITYPRQSVIRSTEHPVHKVYQHGLYLNLQTLDPVSAKALIQKPLASVLEYDENVVNQIVNHANGHPYLINLICREIVQNMRDKRQSHVQAEDLTTAVDSLLKYGANNFHFAIEKIDKNHAHALVSQIAFRQNNGDDWVDLNDIIKDGSLTDLRVKQIAKILEEHNILAFRFNEDDQSIQCRFAIEYFRQWVCRQWL